jgi:integrase/recombinase XerD
MKHKDYLPAWKKAMEYGLLGGRPFSAPTRMVYGLYADGFFDVHEELNLFTLKQALMSVPVERFAKRNKIFQALCSFARFLVQEELMEPGFLEKAKPYQPKRHLPPKKTTVSEVGVEALLQACQNEQQRLIVILLSQTGLRVSEAAALSWEDINLGERTLRVRLAKWGKSRRVGISQKLLSAFEAYRKTQQVGALSQPVFLNKLGEPMDRYGIRIRLQKIGERAGVKVSPHALRRAFVTINANKGRPLPMLQIACGHSNITTTRSYCMTSEEETISAMSQWE